MNHPLRTVGDYELFVYSLAEQFPFINYSTLTVVRKGATLARVDGEVSFDQGYRLVIRERLLFDRLPGVIDGYGYEIWRGEEKLCWYDSQPHPDEPSLEQNHPHHKHVPPEIKHHRIPAPQMSSSKPNLLTLLKEIENLL
jgi:hypothetical protein